MDRQFLDELAETVFTSEREPLGFTLDLKGGRLEIVRANAGGPVTLSLWRGDAEPADPGLEWAWLEASFLRRLDDGVVALADEDGRLGFGLVLADGHIEADEFEAAIQSLVSATEPDVTAPSATTEATFESDMVWVRL